MACHQLHLLHNADCVVSIADSTIAEMGSYTELMQAGGAFAKLMTKHGSADGGDSPKEVDGGEGSVGVITSDADVLEALKGAGESGAPHLAVRCASGVLRGTTGL